jgi:UDP-N-acetylglucosamine acyltransferase
VSRIHPAAVIDPAAELHETVEVGPFAVVEGAVALGPGCVVRPHAHLVGPLTAGCDNYFGTGCVVGERPQHLLYQGEPTRTEIGDGNIFREHVTVHRGTSATGLTKIGSGNFLMAGSHVAHDCRVGDRCVFANGALIGGHCLVEDGVFLSGNCAVHQFTRLGRLAFLSGVSATTKDIPPFLIYVLRNRLGGVNVVGMRRAGYSTAQIDAVRKAFHIIYRQGLPLPDALTRVEQELGEVDAVAELVGFIRRSTRGISIATHVRMEAA